MTLHPLVAGFTDVAEQYELGRPGYPPEVVAAVAERLGLAPGARIADVGAGTGKLTRALVAPLEAIEWTDADEHAAEPPVHAPIGDTGASIRH